MQVNHSSLLPSLLAPHRRFLLALILGTFRFSFSVPILLNLALSSSPPLTGLPFIQFTLSFVTMEGEKTYVCCIAYHTAFSSPSRSTPLCDYLSLSFSVPFIVPSQPNFAFSNARHLTKKAKRDEAVFRAKEREDESKATNKFSGITLSARLRIECAWKLASRLNEGRPRHSDIFA